MKININKIILIISIILALISLYLYKYIDINTIQLLSSFGLSFLFTTLIINKNKLSKTFLIKLIKKVIVLNIIICLIYFFSIYIDISLFNTL